MGRPRFFGAGGGVIGAFARTCSGMRSAYFPGRQLAPSIRTTTAWWRSRSRWAVATTGAPKMSPHSAKLLFEVRIIAPFSQLASAIWKNRFAPPCVMGKQPVSSTTRITARAKKRIFFGEPTFSLGFGEAFGEFGKGRLVDALSGFDGGDTTGLTQAAPFAAGSPTGHNGGRPQTPSRRRRAQARRRRSTPAQLGNG